MTAEQAGDIPWLRQAHSGITGIAAVQLAQMKADQLGLSGMNLLRFASALWALRPPILRRFVDYFQAGFSSRAMVS
ncbi:hypothetical protein [Mesorhizobium tianshanense]|uniref:hypothetical protein n=1 Tax=Mesorhizobium tianshanense TaxID=39844 RepID=UPI0011A16AF2|nr:hypothetical protein [Mesorhizobium tianshanense]